MDLNVLTDNLETELKEILEEIDRQDQNHFINTKLYQRLGEIRKSLDYLKENHASKEIQI